MTSAHDAALHRRKRGRRNATVAAWRVPKWDKSIIREVAMKVVHCKKSHFDIYIGRAARGYAASKWGNPFVIGRDGTRDEVIAKYRTWIVQQPHLMAALPELRGKVLGCWCKGTAGPDIDVPCHGDVLRELVENNITVE